MQNMRDVEVLGKALAPVIAGLVARRVEEATRAALEQIESKSREVDALLEELRAAVPEPVDLLAIATEAAKLVPVPKDGVSVEEDAVRRMVEDAVSAIPPPRDGKDADPQQVASMVAEALAALPVPMDGKSVTLEDVQPVLDAAIAAFREEVTEASVEAVRSCDAATQRATEAAAALRQPEDGKSITAEDVRPLIAEEVGKAMADVPAPKDGLSVTVDDVRPIVQEAVDEAVGRIEIPRARDGEDGRDATQIEILPAIDVERSYPRGSYAKHAGGLWRSFETTHCMRGWECIVEGVQSLSIEQVDERTFQAIALLSSGAESRKDLSIPAVIDRGVFRDGAQIKAGDAVTWGGSFWIAQKDAPTGKPGEPGSDGWRLAVKRGRDGKDGRNGIDKTAPVKVGP